MIGSGTVVKSIRQQFSQGNLVQSESSLDLAITGDGFFAVKTSIGGAQVNYTRNVSFLVDADRYVVDGQGRQVQIYPVHGAGNVQSEERRVGYTCVRKCRSRLVSYQ